MTAKTSRTPRRRGAVFTLNSQSDIWQGRYRLIERTAPSTWTVEYLPDPPETAEKIRQFWADPAVSTDPVWDKTWHECAPGERPRIIRYKTREEQAEEEITRRAALAGTRTTFKFNTRAQFDRYF